MKRHAHWVNADTTTWNKRIDEARQRGGFSEDDRRRAANFAVIFDHPDWQTRRDLGLLFADAVDQDRVDDAAALFTKIRALY